MLVASEPFQKEHWQPSHLTIQVGPLWVLKGYAEVPLEWNIEIHCTSEPHFYVPIHILSSHRSVSQLCIYTGRMDTYKLHMTHGIFICPNCDPQLVFVSMATTSTPSFLAFCTDLLADYEGIALCRSQR